MMQRCLFACLTLHAFNLIMADHVGSSQAAVVNITAIEDLWVQRPVLSIVSSLLVVEWCVDCMGVEVSISTADVTSVIPADVVYIALYIDICASVCLSVLWWCSFTKYYNG